MHAKENESKNVNAGGAGQSGLPSLVADLAEADLVRCRTGCPRGQGRALGPPQSDFHARAGIRRAPYVKVHSLRTHKHASARICTRKRLLTLRARGDMRFVHGRARIEMHTDLPLKQAPRLQKVVVRIRVVAVLTISIIAHNVEDQWHPEAGPQRSRLAEPMTSVTKVKGCSNGRRISTAMVARQEKGWRAKA